MSTPKGEGGDVEALGLKGLAEALDVGLVGDGREGIGGGMGRLGGVARDVAPDAVEGFGFRIPGFKGVVGDRPAGGGAFEVAEGGEILGPVAEEDGAVELGVATDIGVVAGVEGGAGRCRARSHWA